MQTRTGQFLTPIYPPSSVRTSKQNPPAAPVVTIVGMRRELGPAYRLTDWLSEHTADCPQKNQAGVTRTCGAIMPDLRDLP
jgi:hypothetical protein